MSERISIDELVDADLIVGSIYEWGQDISFKFEPLHLLLEVANTGGFRPKKTVKGKPWEYAYVVLYSTGGKEEWPDNIDAEKALFTYFGDNKAPSDDWAKTPGNRILGQVFSKKGDQNDRREIYPFFFFTIVPNTRHAQFRGLAVPGHQSIESQEDLLIEERDSSDGMFLNYKASFSLLNIPIVKREFINELLQGNSLGDAAPLPWREWIETGEYDLLPASQIDLKRQSGVGKTSRSVKQYQMIREAAESIEGIMSSKYILDFIDEKYPGTNRRSIQTVIRAFTVNNDKRIGPFPENQKPRIYDRRYDILYQPVQSRGKYELYDARRHGYWSIVYTGTDENKYGLEVRDSGFSLPKPIISSKDRRRTTSKGKAGEPPIHPEGAQERMEYDMIGSAIVRNQDVVAWVKTAENSECQICGFAIESPDGSKSTDLHHIWPLGSPHGGYERGYDRIDNAICLCPNHHREMHMGLFYIEPESYRIVYHDESQEFHDSVLRRSSDHELGDVFLNYHRDAMFNKWQ